MRFTTLAAVALIAMPAARASDPVSATPELRGVATDSSGERFNLSTPGASHSDWLSLADLIASSVGKGACILSVEHGASIAWDGSPVEAGKLQSMLALLHSQAPDLPITIQADDKSDIRELAFVMDSCRRAGLNRFKLQSP